MRLSIEGCMKSNYHNQCIKKILEIKKQKMKSKIRRLCEKSESIYYESTFLLILNKSKSSINDGERPNTMIIP